MAGGCGAGCRGCAVVPAVPFQDVPRLRTAARQLTVAAAVSLAVLAACVWALEVAQVGPGLALALLIAALAGSGWVGRVATRRHRGSSFQGGHHA